MNERVQTKYMTVLEDMYLNDEFKIEDIRKKHGVGKQLFNACIRLGYIKKVSYGRYRWDKGVPRIQHITKVSVELKVMKQPKRTIKLLWGLITYEV